MADLERSTFRGRPCYRYIRSSDRLPSTAEARRAGLSAPIKVKLFDPTGAGSWYITGYDPETRLATGAVDGLGDLEIGDLDMPELVALRGRYGLPLERDLDWDADTPLGAVADPDWSWDAYRAHLDRAYARAAI